MFDEVISIIAPDYCYSCLEKGKYLCSSCIYNIVNDGFSVCFECQLPTNNGVCKKCQSGFSKCWIVGQREDELGKLIDDFKWGRKYGAHKPLVELLLSVLPVLPSETVVVPVPTISRHKRLRGYDQTVLLAKRFSKLRGLKYKALLKRQENTVQHTAKNKRQRIEQANRAFKCEEILDSTLPYLIIDDIVTTGSTIKAATRVLKRAGAREVWVAAIARQPLKK